MASKLKMFEYHCIKNTNNETEKDKEWTNIGHKEANEKKKFGAGEITIK